MAVASSDRERNKRMADVMKTLLMTPKLTKLGTL